MNEIELKIYDALAHAAERDCGTLEDDDQFVQVLGFDSLTTAVFLLELESYFPGRFDMQKFRRDMTFGELKELLSA